MVTAAAVVTGTVDWFFQSFGTTLISGILGRVVTPRVQPYIVRQRGSRFVTGRILRSRIPLWKRGIHVPNEEGLIELADDLDVQRDVEYVIQEHDANRAGRHYDLRLVIKGKSVSWAIPMKGKRDGVSGMPKPGERWAAIRQPDHTVEYNEFEGVIPEGNLGAGTVKIWAKGTCDIHKIEDGNVHFEIFSGPAKGRYVIVDTQKGQGLILSKKPEPTEIWTKPRYTKKEEEFLDGLEGQKQFVAERKVDGAAVELRIEDGRARVLSHRVSKKTGQLVEHTSRLVHLDDLRTEGLDGTRLRAEAWHPRGVNFLSGTLNSTPENARAVQRRAGPIRLDVFDATHIKGEDIRSRPYAERRSAYDEVVQRLGSANLQPVRQVHSNFRKFYGQQIALKKAPTDGVVVKDVTKAYDEKPIIKVKPSDLADCEVLRLSEGQGKHEGRLGALTVEVPDNGKSVQVGTGFTDWERQWIWNHRDEIPGEVARVDFHVRHGKRTETGPRFDSWHPDKSEAALKMYADAMGVSPYQLKSAAGWRRAA